MSRAEVLRVRFQSRGKRPLDGFDASWVAPRLWVGAYPGHGPEMVARARAVGIDQVVRVANQEWHEFDVGIDCVPMLDAQESAFERASNAVAGYLRRGKRVLVTCQAGINRSALVAGLAMVKAYGYTGEHALREVQANRRSADHLALCNPAFAEYLRASTAPGALGPLLRFLALVAA